jgi:hypothetical protein
LIGDRAIDELSEWVADGNVHELHLSDLGRPVKCETVYRLLHRIHTRKSYPYPITSKDGTWHYPLWLRLEHNGITGVDELLQKVEQEGVSLTVVASNNLAKMRPGSRTSGGAKKSEVAAVSLVLFRSQELKIRRQMNTRGGKSGMMYSQDATSNTEEQTRVTASIGGPEAWKSLEPTTGRTQKTACTMQNLLKSRKHADFVADGSMEASVEWGHLPERVQALLGSCVPRGDEVVQRNWIKHLTRARNLEEEASRLLRMTQHLQARMYLPTQQTLDEELPSTIRSSNCGDELRDDLL